MTKRILAFVILILLLASTMPLTGSAQGFKAGQWAIESIELANTYGIIPRELYAQDYTQAIQRKHMAEIVVKAYENIHGEVQYTPSSFTDVYSNIYIDKVCSLGIMNGRGNNEFAPYDVLKREEAVKVILVFKALLENKALSLDWNAKADFADFDLVSDWAKPYVAYAKVNGVINGYEDNTFRYNASVSVQEAIALVLRCAQYNTKEKPTITSVSEGCVVSSESDFNVTVSAKGRAKLYFCEVPNYSNLFYAYGNQYNEFKIEHDYLWKDNTYVMFAECDGVYSDIVKFYTDRINIPVTVTQTQSEGIYRISWEAITGIDVYTLRITESRNSYYKGDIHSKDPIDYVVQGSYLDLNLNIKRLYTIQIFAGNYSETKEIYIPGIWTPEHDIIESTYPTTQQEALDATVEISVPVWRLKNGQKVSGTAYLRVHKLIADRVKLVFEEIYNGPEKFPIKDVGGYSWRGGRSEHNGGTAIDINATENFCVYNNGTIIGSHWKPYEDVYSITPYGDVVTAFEKYGFTWGGDAWRNPRDYMHFSFLGT